MKTSMTTDTKICKVWTATSKTERVTIEITRKGVICDRYTRHGVGYYTEEREVIAYGHQSVLSAIIWLSQLNEPAAQVAINYLAQLKNVSPCDTIEDLFPVTLFD